MRQGKKAGFSWKNLIFGSICFAAGAVLALPASASPLEFVRAAAAINPGHNGLMQLALVVPPAKFRRVAPINPDLFGSVALRAGNLAAQDKWDWVLDEHADQLLVASCDEASDFCNGNWRVWRSLVEAAGSLSPVAQLNAVNQGVNRLMRYTEDRVAYGVSDHWARLQETVARGEGDCEDFATAKMWVLAALGVPLDRMQLVLLKDKWRNEPHAVLAVHLDGRAYVLDNLMNTARPADTLTHYVPVYSLTSTMSYVHGERTKVGAATLRQMDQPAPLPTARPL